MKIYRASHGSHFSHSDAKIIGEFIEKNFPNGVTADQLLDAARPKSSPIHRYFEWDDSIAAEKWRKEQAGNIIRCLIVDIRGVETRAYHHVYVQEDDEKKYVNTTIAIRKQTLWKQVIDQAIAELIGWRDRYKQYSKFSKVVSEINKIERTTNEKGKSKVKSRRKTNSYTSAKSIHGKNNNRRSQPSSRV